MAEKKFFIQACIYNSIERRIFDSILLLSDDPRPYLDGIRINSPHYLVKIVLKESMTQRFTLVVSQYEKTNAIHYSLRVYSTCPFSLNKFGILCKYNHEVIFILYFFFYFLLMKIS